MMCLKRTHFSYKISIQKPRIKFNVKFLKKRQFFYFALFNIGGLCTKILKAFNQLQKFMIFSNFCFFCICLDPNNGEKLFPSVKRWFGRTVL